MVAFQVVPLFPDEHVAGASSAPSSLQSLLWCTDACVPGMHSVDARISASISRAAFTIAEIFPAACTMVIAKKIVLGRDEFFTGASISADSLDACQLRHSLSDSLILEAILEAACVACRPARL